MTKATAPSGVCCIASAGIDTDGLGDALGLADTDGEAPGELDVTVGDGVGSPPPLHPAKEAESATSDTAYAMKDRFTTSPYPCE